MIEIFLYPITLLSLFLAEFYTTGTTANDFENFPQFPGAEPRVGNNYPPQQSNFWGEFFSRVVDILAEVWDALLKTRNVIVYLIIIIVGFLLWPIGFFLIICILCWIFRRLKHG
jgi:hypothetical protein